MPESRVDVLCRECGSRRTVQPHVQPVPCATPDDTRGFMIDHVEVTLLGRCPVCRAMGFRHDEPTAS